MALLVGNSIQSIKARFGSPRKGLRAYTLPVAFLRGEIPACPGEPVAAVFDRLFVGKSLAVELEIDLMAQNDIEGQVTIPGTGIVKAIVGKATVASGRISRRQFSFNLAFPLDATDYASLLDMSRKRGLLAVRPQNAAAFGGAG